MKRTFFRPLQLAIAGFGTILCVGLALMLVLTWRNTERLNGAHAELRFNRSAQLVGVMFMQVVEARDSGDAAGASRASEDLRRELERLTTIGVRLDETTNHRLREAAELLAPDGPDTTGRLWAAFELFRQVSVTEATAQERLVRRMSHDTQRELRVALATLLGLIGLGIVIVFSLRSRVQRPLQSMGFFMSRLSEGEFEPMPDEQIDPLLVPLFRNYNEMVQRLGELEEERRQRADSLVRDVRTATEALLDQQRSLARAQRLAVTGELAAALAHELRNPLAGVQVTLNNIRRELPDEELHERLDLVIAELARLDRLLSDVLSSARHQPEPARSFDLRRSVEDLVALTRYQLSPEVRLVHDIPDVLRCRLPEGGLRQVLLNLILNAAQSLPDDGGTIMISAGTAGDRLSIRVTDDGPGFPPDVLADLPRPFLSNRERGSGLGLAIVHRFVRDMDGQLTLRNRSPHGAEVVLELPYRVGNE